MTDPRFAEIESHRPYLLRYALAQLRDGQLAGAILLGDPDGAPSLQQAFDRALVLPDNRAEMLFPAMRSEAPLSAADLRALEDIVAKVQVPVGTTAFLSGQSEDMSDSFRSLQFVLLLAIFLVYLVMASQFESLIHPFVILLTIPLAIIGAIWALWITGTTVNVVAYIGLIMLAGIVVNQSIVLIDAVNKARERGLSKRDAIVEAGRVRLRPILITKLTTILGLLPMALGIGEGAEVRAPMAITVIGGVLLTTFLTLLVIPVVYSVLDRKVYAPPTPAPDAAAEMATG